MVDVLCGTGVCDVALSICETFYYFPLGFAQLFLIINMLDDGSLNSGTFTFYSSFNSVN